MKNLLEIFNTLGVNKENGLFITSEGVWQEECQFSSRVGRLINNKLKPDAFFVFDHKPLILFYDSPHDKEVIHKSLWNFNESPVVFFAYNDSIEIYNGYHYLKDDKSLELLAGIESLSDFNYFELVSGKTWEKYQPKLTNAGRVDFKLLKNVEAARNILVHKNKLEPNIANILIGKIIFVRYLVDRKIKIGFGEERCWTNDDLCTLLSNREKTVRFFKYLEKKFNGDMFLLNDSQYQLIEQPSLNTLIGLLSEDDLGDGQRSLFKLYDFSIIPIEFISNVYESFIGEKSQANEGAYYTPLFLVDYILNETVEKHLRANTQEYNCKVLDPACGSGIFLVETLRKIIERYIQLHPEVAENSEVFKNILRQLAVDNIFGVDKNLAAIQVAIFSIQLTLLDYQQPASVETFRFPKLLHTNFFEADFFDTNHDYNTVLKHSGIRFIIGNPPWKGNGLDSLGKQYLKDRKKSEKEKKYPIAVNNGEIAEGFVLRVSDFTNESTEIALIVRSSILYNLGYKTDRSAFRDYWTQEFYINKVFELAPVRKEVFDKSHDPAIAPTAVLFYKYANGYTTDRNVVEHISIKPNLFFSLFKVFSLTRNDIKRVEQKKLKDFDWLWKVLVYGSYLDFNFICRLKEEYRSIKEIVSKESQFIVSTGIHMRSFKVLPQKNTTKIRQLNLIKPEAISFSYIDYSIISHIDFDKIDIVKNPIIYQAPMLLIKKGVDTKLLKTPSAISDSDLIFKDGITSVKPIDNNREILLKISALLYSDLYTYLAINTFTSIGVEREQAQNYDKFSIPFVDCDISDSMLLIEHINTQINKEQNKFPIDSNVINKLRTDLKYHLQEVDNKIFESICLNDNENALIDFALNINRTLINKNSSLINSLYLPFTLFDKSFEGYANLFLDRFSKSLNTETHSFMAEVWYSKQIIGVFFKVVPKNDVQSSIVWIDKSKDDLLKKAISLSSQKITDKLFVQKDLRGFEKDFFYVFKPNEKRLWHKAIGYQDVDEFMDAILKMGRRSYDGE